MKPSPKNKRIQTGVVVSRSGNKTVAVAVSRAMSHPLYGKKRVTTKKYLTHDPDNTAQVGDAVAIRETRPLSARKRWIIVSREAKKTEA